MVPYLISRRSFILENLKKKKKKERIERQLSNNKMVETESRHFLHQEPTNIVLYFLQSEKLRNFVLLVLFLLLSTCRQLCDDEL